MIHINPTIIEDAIHDNVCTTIHCPYPSCKTILYFECYPDMQTAILYEIVDHFRKKHRSKYIPQLEIK